MVHNSKSEVFYSFSLKCSTPGMIFITFLLQIYSILLFSFLTCLKVCLVKYYFQEWWLSKSWNKMKSITYSVNCPRLYFSSRHSLKSIGIMETFRSMESKIYLILLFPNTNQETLVIVIHYMITGDIAWNIWNRFPVTNNMWSTKFYLWQPVILLVPMSFIEFLWSWSLKV